MKLHAQQPFPVGRAPGQSSSHFLLMPLHWEQHLDLSQERPHQSVEQSSGEACRWYRASATTSGCLFIPDTEIAFYMYNLIFITTTIELGAFLKKHFSFSEA